MRAYVACVGLIVLIGCFTLVVAPDDWSAPGQALFSNAMPTVVIDAGHGGNDSGARWKGVQEKALTLDVAFRVQSALRKLGFQTVMTRTEDRYVPLPERTAIANALDDPVLFVSIHFNQGSGGDVSGIETFYASFKDPPAKDWTWVGFFSQSEPLDSGENLAAEVQSAAVNKTGARNRGIRARDLFVTRNTRVPAILIEGGFITNTMESHLLTTPDYADRLADGIAEGIAAWCHSQPGRIPSPLAKAH